MLEQLDYVLVEDTDDLLGMIQAYISRPSLPVAFDTETTGLDPYLNRLVSLQFMQFGYAAVLVDVRHWTPEDFRLAGMYLQDLFSACKIVGMNLSFDFKMVKRWLGVSIGKCYDIMLADQVLHGLGMTGGRSVGIEFNLKAIAARYKIPVSKEERNVFIDMDKHPLDWQSPFSPETLKYMAQDVEVLEKIYDVQVEKIVEAKLGHVLNLENRALPAIASIEYNGIYVDEKGWRAVIEEKAALAKELEAKAIDVFGEAIALARAKRFRKQMKAFNAWREALEQEEAKALETFNALVTEKHIKGLDGNPLKQKGVPIKFNWNGKEYTAKWDGEKYAGWGTFKKDFLAGFREMFPRPDLPKLESHSPYAAWLAEHDRYQKTIDLDGLDTKEAKEFHIAQMMRVWEQDHPRPFEDERLYNLHQSRNLCYEPINLGSVPQMLDAFKELNIPLTSTAKEALDDLPEGMYPEVDLLKQWRAAQMFPVKFGDKLLASINPITGRIHPWVTQIGADTGRSSVSNPPWQQIPAKTEDGKRLRACVVAMPGNVLLTSDYPNIELRILADYAQDRRMLSIFADEDADLHAETAIMMFGLDRATFRPKKDRHPNGALYRAIAKTINFGLVYGMSVTKLARTLKISKEDAQELMDKYFALYPGVVQWLKKQRILGTSRLFSLTLAGRKRFFAMPSRSDKDFNKIKSAIERRACNSPIQGSSADITKLALALAFERLPEAAKIVAVVHDEIVVECPKEISEQCAKILAQAMKESCLKYLKHVHIPDFEVNIGLAWEH